MVTTSKLQYYQQDPAWTSANLNYATTLLQPGHHLGVPSLYTPAICAANAVSPRRSSEWSQLAAHQNGVNCMDFVPCLPNSKAAHQNGVNWLPNLAPTKNEYPSDTKRFLPHLIGLKSPPTDAPTNSQKRFLICDKSGNQTRFFFSQGRPSENVTPKKLFGAYGLYQNEILNASHVKPVIEEKLDESYVNGEESNTHEDTDEINALLYSSDDIEGDEDSDVYGEDDEVTSTDRSPCANQRCCGCTAHEQQSAELTEVISSDGTCKRQKMLDGGYKKSSSIESRGPDDDVEARCVRGSLPSSGKDKDSSLSTKERIVKIRETLRILGSLIPGIKSKDPLLVIDESINYLKSLRGKAKALGVELPQDYPQPLVKEPSNIQPLQQ